MKNIPNQILKTNKNTFDIVIKNNLKNFYNTKQSHLLYGYEIANTDWHTLNVSNGVQSFIKSNVRYTYSGLFKIFCDFKDNGIKKEDLNKLSYILEVDTKAHSIVGFCKNYILEPEYPDYVERYFIEEGGNGLNVNFIEQYSNSYSILAYGSIGLFEAIPYIHRQVALLDEYAPTPFDIAIKFTVYYKPTEDFLQKKYYA